MTAAETRVKEVSSGDVAVGRAVCIAQVAIALIAAAVFAACSGRASAMASLYGGAVALMPTVYFAVRVFWKQQGRDPQRLVAAMYRAELGKLVLTALLFAFGVKVFAEQFLALMVTYVACLLAYWLVMARVGF